MVNKAFLLCLVVWVALCSSYQQQKVSVRLAQLLDTHTRARNTAKPSDDVNWWVYFTDKGEYTLEDAWDHLKPESLKRRRKTLEENVVNHEDVPVNNLYIQQVEAIGVTIRRASKITTPSSKHMFIFDSTHVSVTAPSSSSLDKIVSRITKLSFVEKVDVVATYARKGVPASHEEIEAKEKRTSLDYGSSLPQLQMLNVPTAHSQGLNGTGVTIIILDSGFEKTHPAIAHIHIIAEYDFIENDNDTQSFPADIQNYHGTATLSTVGGWDPGNIIGSGFGAKFILAKTEIVLNETHGEEDNFIAAVEWGESLGADIVTASLGYSIWYTYYDMDGTVSPVTKACDMASRRGMVVTISAGNQDNRGIDTPADGFEVITVGAVTADSTVSGFSSVGPAADGRIKPDVAARGSSVFIANAKDVPSAADKTNNYTQASGTSFSCPLVAGVVAIILQVHPTWTPRMVREALQMTASQAVAPDILQGWGIVDVMAAINYIPKNGTCTTNGCSGRGCCVNGECQCELGYFGADCSFAKMNCISYCTSRTSGLGLCMKQASGHSYRCGDPSGPSIDPDTNPQCSGCPTDVCGVCFGYNTTCLVGCDGNVNSTLVNDYCGVCNGTNSTCALPTPTAHAQTTSSSANQITSTLFLISFVLIVFLRDWL